MIAATPLLASSPPPRGPWRRVIPAPNEQLTDEQADSYADTMAPVGWKRYSPAIQGKNAEGRRVPVVAYVREEPRSHEDCPRV